MPPPRAVLIIGASGFVGSALRQEYGAGVAGTYHTYEQPGLDRLDIRDTAAVDALLDRVQPRLVLHPAAQPHVDWCEDHAPESYAINVTGTAHVARAAARIGARYVFFSSDYVFDGATGRYGEEAPTEPLNVYGRHKLEAERLIADITEDFLIVRVCGVYGYEPRGKNFVMALLNRGRAGEPMKVPSDQWGTPTFAPNLAAAVRELAAGNHRGVFHVVGPDYLDRVSFARLACDVFGVSDRFIQPTPTAALGQRAPRPLCGGLDNRRVQALLRLRLLGARAGLEQMRAQLPAASRPAPRS